MTFQFGRKFKFLIPKFSDNNVQYLYRPITSDFTHSTSSFSRRVNLINNTCWLPLLYKFKGFEMKHTWGGGPAGAVSKWAWKTRPSWTGSKQTPEFHLRLSSDSQGRVETLEGFGAKIKSFKHRSQILDILSTLILFTVIGVAIVLSSTAQRLWNFAHCSSEAAR